MKKTLLSLLAFAFAISAGVQTFAATQESSKVEIAAEAIAVLLNEKDDAYVAKFIKLFVELKDKYSNDEAKTAILLEMQTVFVKEVPAFSIAVTIPETVVTLSCYDNSAEMVACTMEYNPMCGKDGATYGNPCSMNAAAVEMAHEGACTAEDKPTVCTLEYAPVCGSDGKTYGNFCSLQASDAMYLFDGTCEDNEEKLTCIEIKQPTQKPCTREYAPVCGKDGKTYSNACMMENAGISLDYTGACSTGACTREYVPVCGKDGKTYSNACMMNAAGIEFESEGAC